jgi:hypothetical protein
MSLKSWREAGFVSGFCIKLFLIFGILKPLSNLRFSLDLFADRPAIALHQTSSKPLGDHPLLKAHYFQRQLEVIIR